MAMTNPGLTNLTAWWKMDETSGNRADSHTNGLTLTDVNTVGYGSGSFAKKTNSAYFQSTNSEYLYSADNANLRRGTSSMFFGFWVYFTSLIDYRMLINKFAQTGSLFEYSAYFDFPSSKIVMSFFDNTTASSSVFSASTVTISTWYYVCAWYDGTKSYMQINNGTVSNGTTQALGTSGTTAQFQLGARTEVSSSYKLDGYIDEFCIYKRVLTADEREWLYNAGAGRTYSELTSSVPLFDNHYRRLRQ